MSERRDKINRRVVRRAFGPAAVDTVRQQHEDLGKVLLALGELEARVSENLSEMRAFHGLSLWGRLRWLVAGF